MDQVQPRLPHRLGVVLVPNQIHFRRKPGPATSSHSQPNSLLIRVIFPCTFAASSSLAYHGIPFLALNCQLLQLWWLWLGPTYSYHPVNLT